MSLPPVTPPPPSSSGSPPALLPLATPLPTVLQKRGTWHQVYRAKIPGDTHKKRIDALKPKLDLFAELGSPGTIAHGFTQEFGPEEMAEWEGLCRERGMLAGVAYGLDDSDPEGKGERIGKVAGLTVNVGGAPRPMAAVTLFDMEGRFDIGARAATEATAMFTAYRTLAPAAVTLDQPWPIWDVHQGFPWLVINGTVAVVVGGATLSMATVDVHCPQAYESYYRRQWGRDAYEKFFAKYEDEWSAREAKWIAAGQQRRPRIPTVEGYAWDLDDCVTMMVTYPTQVMWCEWFPADVVVAAERARNKLWSLGFAGPRAVWDFQRAARIQADGSCGPETMKALGVPMPGSGLIARVLGMFGYSKAA